MSEQTVKNIEDYHTSPEDVGKIAKEAVTQIIEGLKQGSVEQSLEGTTESN